MRYIYIAVTKVSELTTAFQNIFGLEPTGVVDAATWNELTRVYREQRYS
ncbi:MAG: peptidoglycan-binding domain-containing protein [Sedimentibacter sp.]